MGKMGERKKKKKVVTVIEKESSPNSTLEETSIPEETPASILIQVLKNSTALSNEDAKFVS